MDEKERRQDLLGAAKSLQNFLVGTLGNVLSIADMVVRMIGTVVEVGVNGGGEDMLGKRPADNAPWDDAMADPARIAGDGGGDVVLLARITFMWDVLLDEDITVGVDEGSGWGRPGRVASRCITGGLGAQRRLGGSCHGAHHLRRQETTDMRLEGVAGVGRGVFGTKGSS